jgi:hypothetical protein
MRSPIVSDNLEIIHIIRKENQSNSGSKEDAPPQETIRVNLSAVLSAVALAKVEASAKADLSAIASATADPYQKIVAVKFLLPFY